MKKCGLVTAFYYRSSAGNEILLPFTGMQAGEIIILHSYCPFWQNRVGKSILSGREVSVIEKQ
jgi:hypothetical protein